MVKVIFWNFSLVKLLFCPWFKHDETKGMKGCKIGCLFRLFLVDAYYGPLNFARVGLSPLHPCLS